MSRQHFILCISTQQKSTTCCITVESRQPRQQQLFMTWGRVLHLGVRASHTQRPAPQPATMCRPQLGPTHQRAQQPALPRSTTDTARNVVSQPNVRAIPSPPSQTGAAAPAAAAVQCSRSQSQAVELRAVTSKHGMIPPEVAAAAAAASMAAARAPPAIPPSSLIPPHLCRPQPPPS